MNKIYVARPYLPPLNEVIKNLEELWDSRVLTNNGSFVLQLETMIADYLGCEHVSLVTNGSLGILAALHSLDLKKSVLTTPFGFSSTVHALEVLKLQAVFVDIENEFLGLDTDKLKAAITEDTSAILAVHPFGNPCNIDETLRIADEYHLPVVFDGAASFGVRSNDQSILNYGDYSIVSLHATKIFHTFEGGVVISKSKAHKEKIDLFRNHGISGVDSIDQVGVNSKMNEFQAIIGINQLHSIQEIIRSSRRNFDLYKETFKGVDGIRMYEPRNGVEWNYTYVIVRVDERKFGLTRDELYIKLKQKNIICRKYYYPLLSNIAHVKHHSSSSVINLPIANAAANEVLCLPNYHELSAESILTICNLVLESKKQVS